MSFTTATAHLPDGNDIRYMDSGPVTGSSTYTTIVMLHGSGFNSYVFEPLHALASKYNLRLIAVQRRDYEGSTLYSQAEHEDLQNGNPKFLDAHTVLFGHLLEYLIKTHNLPEPKTEGEVREGGVVFLAWSMGCAFATTILSDSRLFGQEQYQLLRRYLTKVVFYDPPFTAFGFDSFTTPGSAQATTQPHKTREEYYEYFKNWVSSYYDTPINWDGDMKELDARTRGSVTIDSWSKEQREKIYQPEAAARVEWHVVRGPLQKTLRDLTQRALFDEASVKSTFPDVPIVHVVCWKTVNTALWGYQSMRVAYQERKNKGEFVRPLSFEIIKEANHFWHWDSPNDFMEMLRRIAV